MIIIEKRNKTDTHENHYILLTFCYTLYY